MEAVQRPRFLSTCKTLCRHTVRPCSYLKELVLTTHTSHRGEVTCPGHPVSLRQSREQSPEPQPAPGPGFASQPITGAAPPEPCCSHRRERQPLSLSEGRMEPAARTTLRQQGSWSRHPHAAAPSIVPPHWLLAATKTDARSLFTRQQQ